MKTIGIIALSGACDKEQILNAKVFFETQGFNVKLSNNIFDKDRYLAGSDDKKITELNNFFSDSDIDIIMCARGGYGAIRLINKINYDMIKNNPKIFCGFSDVTALLLMIYKKTGLITYHGPMAMSDFGNKSFKDEQEKTYNNFLSAIKNKKLEFSGDKIYKAGTAKGIIWGGNLATVTSLCGLDFIPDNDFVFFTEDLNEPTYKIDKMFQQLFNIEKFKNYCKGIVLGDFIDVKDDFWLEEYFKELIERFNIPMVSGFKITHNQEKITLPIGKTCTLNDTLLVID